MIANYQKSESKAIQILQQMGIQDAPVPVFDIAQRLGLQLVEYNLGAETSGVLRIENGKGYIGYNPKDPLVRRRFTIAHETGHYVLKHDNDLFVDSYFLMKYRGNNSYTEDEYIQEQEANAFDAALLMPRSFIHDFFKSDELIGLSEGELIQKMAAKFEVSTTAMTFRLANLNILDLPTS